MEHKDEKSILREADELLEDIKRANKDFEKKTDKIIKDINTDIDTEEKTVKKTEKELEKFEKDTVNKIDRAILESIS